MFVHKHPIRAVMGEPVLAPIFVVASAHGEYKMTVNK